MPKPLRLPDDDRPRKKKKPAGDGPPVGPLIGAGVGGVLLIALVGLVGWAVTRDGPPPPRPAPGPTPATGAPATVKSPPTEKAPPTADEYYQWLVGGTWSRTADDPSLGKRTISLTFLPDKTLVVKQTVPDLLGGLTGEAPGKDKELATTMSVTVEVKGDRLLLVRSSDTELLGAGFKRFRVRLNEDETITLTEQGDESKFQPTPYTRKSGG